jgi:hypothetical protein
MANQVFSAALSGSAITIVYGGQTIARADSDYGFQNLRDLALHPAGEALISYQQLAPTCFGRVAEPPQLRQTADGVELVLEATSADGAMHTRCTVTVRLAPTGNAFEWTFDHDTRVLRTIPFPERFFTRTDADAEFADTGAWIFEFSDPMPHRAFGPKDGPLAMAFVGAACQRRRDTTGATA